MFERKKQTDPRYRGIVRQLQNMSEGKKILNIHIPGTGGHRDGNCPTNYALYVMAVEDVNTAIIKLEAVGSDEDDNKRYIAPVNTDTSFVTPRRLSVMQRFFKPVKFFTKVISSLVESSKDPDKAWMGLESSDLVESVLPFNRKMSKYGGIAFGAGDNSNVAIVINTLKRLKEDKVLPDKIILAGHSRGAVNAIKMANRIFHQFPKIELHMVFTDPVPGPFKDSWQNMTIPPSVKTFLCFYAQNEDGYFRRATHISKLRFVNTNTVVSSYSVQKDHDEITELTGDGQIVLSAIIKMIYELNGAAHSDLCIIRNYNSREDMKSNNSNRSDHNYVCITQIPEDLDQSTREVIELIRDRLDTKYEDEGPLKCFVYTKNPLQTILEYMEVNINKISEEVSLVDDFLKNQLGKILTAAKELKADVEYLKLNGELKSECLTRFNEFREFTKMISKKIDEFNDDNWMRLFKPFNNVEQKYVVLCDIMNEILCLAHVQTMIVKENKLRSLITAAGESLLDDSISVSQRINLNFQLSQLVNLVNEYMEQTYRLDKQNEFTKDVIDKEKGFKKELTEWLLNNTLYLKDSKIKALKDLYEGVSCYSARKQNSINQVSLRI